MFFSDWNATFFETAEANLIGGWVGGIVKVVSKKGGEGGDGRGKKLKVVVFSWGERGGFKDIGEGGGVMGATDAVVDGDDKLSCDAEPE